ncbi:MAG: radical SAM protein [Gammaproteobacteria bacterium]|nr:radical SAM protein [Gammaproteobacteria bacterium]
MSFSCTFINSPDPLYSQNQNYGLEFMPTWVFNLSSHIPEELGYELDFYDTRFDKVDAIKQADVYLFSGINQDYHTLKKVWLAIKRQYPEAKSIIGGPICWSFNQVGELHLLDDFDHIFVGDGEDHIESLLEKISSESPLEKVVVNQKRFAIQNSKAFKLDFFEHHFDKYYGVVIEVSRGCPFLCEFCDIRIMNDNNRAHNKPVELIVEEIEQVMLRGKQQFIFACDNLIGDLEWAESLTDHMIEMIERTGLQPNVYTWLTINVAKHPRLLEKMRRAGFDLLFIGIESFNVNSLIETAKVQNTKRMLEEDIQNIQSYGFVIIAGLIFGFDTDTEECFDITLSGLKESGLLSGDPNFLTALPGTPLYRRMQLSSRLRKTNDLMSSTSTGGVKYETNIKYLIPRDRLINGFLKFVKNYNNGKFQYERLRKYFQILHQHGNYIPMQQGANGFAKLDKVLLLIFKSPRSLYLLFKRGLMFSSQALNLYYAIKGFVFVYQQKSIDGRFAKYQFWLFAWSNYVLKYKNVSDSDFDIGSVEEDYDLNNLIPVNYRETAQENIPSSKIDAQVRATVKGLKALQERNSEQKARL